MTQDQENPADELYLLPEHHFVIGELLLKITDQWIIINCVKISLAKYSVEENCQLTVEHAC